LDDRDPLGEVVWDLLRRMLRETLARRSGGHLVESSLDELDLRLRVPLRGPIAGQERFVAELTRSIERVVDDAIERAAAFRPGYAFCHRCAGAVCEHAAPPSARHVFLGYGPTGTPRWEDFAQVCLDRRHPEVDRLYHDPPAFLTLLQDAAELRGGLLDAFAAERYELVGQLIAGFFPVRTYDGEGRGVLALTLQVAAWRPPRGRLRLGLNLLGRTPTGEDLGMLWERHHEIPWRRAVGWAQSALSSVTSVKGRPEPSRELVERRCLGILRGLARRLEHEQRARFRRTRHAEERHDSGERPTRKALDDTRAAGPEAFFVDERRGTIVVLGDRGRTHFFTAEGRLVSSVRYSREAIERKRKRGVWREAHADEAESLLQRLAEGQV
jgi:hypothetical protein